MALINEINFGILSGLVEAKEELAFRRMENVELVEKIVLQNATIDAFESENDAFEAEKDAFEAQKDAFQARKDAFEARKDAFEAEKAALRAEKVFAHTFWNSINAGLTTENEQLRAIIRRVEEANKMLTEKNEELAAEVRLWYNMNFENRSEIRNETNPVAIRENSLAIL